MGDLGKWDKDGWEGDEGHVDVEDWWNVRMRIVSWSELSSLLPLTVGSRSVGLKVWWLRQGSERSEDWRQISGFRYTVLPLAGANDTFLLFFLFCFYFARRI